MSLALQNQLRAAFPRELDAIAKRARSRRYDPSAASLVPRGLEKWERIARGEEAQRIAEIVRRRDARWIGDPRVDQWVERVYCGALGFAQAGAAAAVPLGPVDVLGGSTTIIGALFAELGITLSTGVNIWASQYGGTTLDVSEGTGTNQPAYSANNASIWGRPTVTGDGSNDKLSSLNWNPPAPGTTPTFWRLVANRVVDVTNGSLFGGGGSTVMRCFRGSATQLRCSDGVSGPLVTMTVNTWYRVEALFQNSAATDYLRIGANTSGVGTATGNNDPGAGIGALFAQQSAGTNPGNYAIQKVLVLNAEPSPLQKAIFDGIDRTFYNGNITL